MGSVIFVDDDALIRTANVQALQLAGIDVTAFEGAQAALRQIPPDFNGVIVSDIRMPHIDGLQFFQMIKEIDPAIPVILITGHGDVPMAVAALKDGAHDFLAKPFAGDHLIASVQRALERRQLELDNRRLRAMVEAPVDSAFIGQTPAIVRLREAIDQVAGADVDVLIEGETGVGKELVAMMLHRQSARRGQPFVTINGGALPPGTSADRQLFGDESADAGRDARRGQIERAHRGTLFVDEIDRLDAEQQTKMLRVIEEREVLPVGSVIPRQVDLRIVATSRQDLQRASQTGAFREDLFYAINIVRLRIPPLRERRNDIPLLYAHFVDEACTQLRRPAHSLSDRDRRYLLEHDWPGNVRELRSFAFQSVLGLSHGDTNGAGAEPVATLPERVGQFEAMAIRSTLEECNGSVPEALKRLGLPRKTFYDKLHRHNIAIEEFRR